MVLTLVKTLKSKEDSSRSPKFSVIIRGCFFGYVLFSSMCEIKRCTYVFFMWQRYRTWNNKSQSWQGVYLDPPERVPWVEKIVGRETIKCNFACLVFANEKRFPKMGTCWGLGGGIPKKELSPSFDKKKKFKILEVREHQCCITITELVKKAFLYVLPPLGIPTSTIEMPEIFSCSKK